MRSKHPEKLALRSGIDEKRESLGPYFNEVLIDVNLLLSLVPSPFTVAMIASAMSKRTGIIAPEAIAEAGRAIGYIYVRKVRTPRVLSRPLRAIENLDPSPAPAAGTRKAIMPGAQQRRAGSGALRHRGTNRGPGSTFPVRIEVPGRRVIGEVQRRPGRARTIRRTCRARCL